MNQAPGARRGALLDQLGVLLGQVGELGGREVGLLDVHARAVVEIGDVRLLAARRRPAARQADPQVPVGEHAQPLVEAAELVQQRGRRDHVRAAAGDRVVAHQVLREPLGRRRRVQAGRLVVAVHDDGGGVRERGAGGLGGVDLLAQLARRPVVVVVQERGPAPGGGREPVVAGAGDAHRATRGAAPAAAGRRARPAAPRCRRWSRRRRRSARARRPPARGRRRRRARPAPTGSGSGSRR